ncbi:MAG: DUF4430 domain-containing protein [Patescibacteria group bacterium]|nr:DUF4430 domain-containing protein [Patescibacteria group bacterium]
MKKYGLYFLIAVALLSAGCNKKPESPNPRPDNNPPIQQQAGAPMNQATASQPTVKNIKPQDEPIYITVYQTVQGSNLNNASYQVAENTKALALLKTSHKVETTDYGSLGEMVKGIDGAVARIDQFWAFYVNGKLANEGAGAYTLKNNDKIEWKLNSVNSYQPNSK